ncbi:hypothetical protein QA596_03430 [Balneolales bacterium ANBcel1]|nr:hypothetical protein [Balneolales bacterium ANBcel1]
MNTRFTSTLILLLLIAFAFSSCEQIRGVVDDEEEEIVEEEPEPVVEEPTRPSWYDPSRLFWVEGDTLYVTSISVAADSADARRIAFQTLPENVETAVSSVMAELTGGSGTDPDASLTQDEADRLISMLTFESRGHSEALALSTETAFFGSGEHARYYILRSYLKSSWLEAIQNP